MLQDHVMDSIKMIAGYNSGRIYTSAYFQLIKLTKAAAKVCGIDYEKELAKKINDLNLG